MLVRTTSHGIRINIIQEFLVTSMLLRTFFYKRTYLYKDALYITYKVPDIN